MANGSPNRASGRARASWGWRGAFSRDMGIDLGTANTLVYVRGRGIVMQEPSVVAINRDTKDVLAVGNEAKQMVGRTPENIVAVRPMKDGVIADFDVTEKMLSYFIEKAMKGRGTFRRPRVVVSVPSGVTEVEKRAVLEAVRSAGARDARLIEEPMAAAIGCGLPVQEPTGSMVVDIGGGTTEVAIISLGGIVSKRSIRVASDELDEAVVQHVRRTYNVLIGERTAEEIKMTIGTAYPLDEEEFTDIRGRDLVTGLPKTVRIGSEEIRDALAEPIAAILDSVRSTLERTPPELAADIMDKGFVMAGGGSLLRGITRLLSEETGMPVHLAEDPLTAIVLGNGITLEHFDQLSRVLISPRRPA